jgi:hypothetical protein
VRLPTSPERLGTVELLPLLPVPRAWSFPRGGYARLLKARRGRSQKIARTFPWRDSILLRRPIVAWKPPRTLVETVVTSLHALCALRTRERLSEARRAVRERAAESIRGAPPAQRAEIRRQAKLVNLAHDDTHITRLEPSLDLLQQRLRTASRALTAYIGGLRVRQRAFIAASAGGIAGGGSDRALARWIMVRCDALEADIGFLRAEMQGNAAAALTGHAGAADSKAWHRQRAKTKLWLKDVGAPSSLGPTLFPDSFGQPNDPDTNRQQKDRERKEVRRARKRRFRWIGAVPGTSAVEFRSVPVTEPWERTSRQWRIMVLLLEVFRRVSANCVRTAIHAGQFGLSPRLPTTAAWSCSSLHVEPPVGATTASNRLVSSAGIPTALEYPLQRQMSRTGQVRIVQAFLTATATDQSRPRHAMGANQADAKSDR